MKQLQLDLNKRLLIVEYNSEVERDLEFSLMNAFRNPNIINFGHKVKPICKGSELNEDIAGELVKNSYSENESSIMYKDYKAKYDDEVLYTALESFISSIKANGYYWNNPIDFKDDEMDFDKRQQNRIDWERAESRTFNPEKTLIFEIL